MSSCRMPPLWFFHQCHFVSPTPSPHPLLTPLPLMFSRHQLTVRFDISALIIDHKPFTFKNKNFYMNHFYFYPLKLPKNITRVKNVNPSQIKSFSLIVKIIFHMENSFYIHVIIFKYFMFPRPMLLRWILEKIFFIDFYLRASLVIVLFGIQKTNMYCPT